MYKKLLFIFIWTILILPAYAHFSANTLERVLYAKMEEGNSNQQFPKWVRLLKQQETLAQKIQYQTAFPYNQSVSDLIAGHDKDIYLKRFVQVQNLIEKNIFLAKYTFQTPDLQDFIHLSEDRLQTLFNFLNHKGQPRIVQTPQPFVLSVQLGSKTENSLEIWIDTQTKKIYLMSNNFYISAESRYALHLK